MTDSNSKGARGELQVRNLIRPWWGLVEPDATFERTPRSGGWHGSGDFDMAGDLMTTAQHFPFCIEVKWREGWTRRSVEQGFRSPVWGWWRQACRDAGKTDPARIPMLWFKKARDPWWIALPVDYVTGRRRVMAPDIMFGPPVVKRRFDDCPTPALYRADRFLTHDPGLFDR